jgi:ribosomal protein S8E
LTFNYSICLLTIQDKGGGGNAESARLKKRMISSRQYFKTKFDRCRQTAIIAAKKERKNVWGRGGDYTEKLMVVMMMILKTK